MSMEPSAEIDRDLAALQAGNNQQLRLGADGPRVRNQDKRTSRIENGKSFQREILEHRKKLPADFGIPEAEDVAATVGIKVCVRKRPLFPHEVNNGDYDATTVNGRVMIVHDGRMKPDMVHMNHNTSRS